MRFVCIVVLMILTIYACREEKSATAEVPTNISSISGDVPIASSSVFRGPSVIGEIATPEGYMRSIEGSKSYGSYLRSLPLHAPGSLVRYYDGSYKRNSEVHYAVVDLPIGDQDLHQCADAVIRLRAEYLYHAERYDDIHFNFTNGFQVDYMQWRQGRRIIVEGNRTHWDDGDIPSQAYEDFWEYLETIFMYAGTASLSQELTSKKIEEADIGDILIQGGHPGHALLIVDKAYETSSGKTIFLLAQSYMPAQEIHVLENNNSEFLTPWYVLSEEVISTPEWTFHSGDLKSFDTAVE